MTFTAKLPSYYKQINEEKLKKDHNAQVIIFINTQKYLIKKEN
jgi:hypothetical protein